MKQVLVLAASPDPKGNSSTLLQECLRGISDHGGIEIRFFDLNVEVFHHYDFAHRRPLPEETRLQALLDDLKEVSGVIIATPTYNFSLPANLKNFIDRIGCVALDYTSKNIFGQPVGQLGHLRNLYIVTGGTPNWMKRLLFFLFPDFTLRVQFAYYGVRRHMSLYAGGFSHAHPISQDTGMLDRSYQLGRRFASRLLAS